MKTLFFLSALLFGLYVNAQPPELTLQQTVAGEDRSFQVKVEKSARTVEVIPVEDPAFTAPPYMKFRLLRKNKSPVEIQLQTIQAPKEPLRYTGTFDRWNESYIGFEVVFSFDKKTWKKISDQFR